MSFLLFEQVEISDTVLTGSVGLSPPANATHAEIQADTQDIRYTMDGATDPTQTFGMILNTGDIPKFFALEEIKLGRFVRGAGSDAKLNLHYFAGRDV